MNLINQIERYVPQNRQEEKDRAEIMRQIKTYSDIFFRQNSMAHMTASAWVVNRERNKVLMAYHKIYDSWAWLGGHADGNENLSEVAIKEVSEESGLKNLKLLKDDIFSLEILTVDGHIKKGDYVSSHLHLNVTYLIEGDEKESLHSKEDENSDVAWFYPKEALSASTEPWFVENIYKKLIAKTEAFTGKGII